MRALTGELLLAAWDNAASEHELDRALTMLSLAMPESSREQLAGISIAERNLLLLRLRELSFGPTLRGFTSCSQCGARLEFELGTAPMLSHLRDKLPNTPLAWTDGGHSYSLRPVNSKDLFSLLNVRDANAAAENLLTRCLEVDDSVFKENSPNPPPDLLDKFETLNSATEMECVAECPECAAKETFDFDIARFFWLEIRHAAQRLMTEIHDLASAYGWSEMSIASMSPRRRGAYMGMLSQ